MHWPAALPQGQKPFTAQAHEPLPLGQREAVVAAVAREQFVLACSFCAVEGDRGLAELLLQKRGKGVATTLQIGETAVGLELQALLQGQHPGVQAGVYPVGRLGWGWAVE